MRASEIVHRFLSSIGRPEAAAQYLRMFRATQKERFALLFVDAFVVQDRLGSLIDDLHFLQELELTPVLCLESEALRSQLVTCLPAWYVHTPCELSDAAKIAQAGRTPLLVASDRAARNTIASSLCPRKVIFIIDQSGLQPAGESVRSLVNLRTDFAALSAEGVLSSVQQDLLCEIQELFAQASHTFTVSVTSAQDLLRELFTVKGAGTLLRRGTKVQRVDSYADLDLERFSELMHSAFERRPIERFYQRPILRVFLAKEYRGAAVVEERGIAPYLSKFAVDLRAQGEGIGGDLWRALCADYKRFYWRSRPGNPIAAWYAGECDGLVRGQSWTVYWRGLQPSEIEAAVATAQLAPTDFPETSE